jgi:hypothetical protein
LNPAYWSGIQQGKDVYPKKNKDGGYLIHGDQFSWFKAIKIEIFGANI